MCLVFVNHKNSDNDVTRSTCKKKTVSLCLKINFSCGEKEYTFIRKCGIIITPRINIESHFIVNVLLQLFYNSNNADYTETVPEEKYEKYFLVYIYKFPLYRSSLNILMRPRISLDRIWQNLDEICEL